MKRVLVTGGAGFLGFHLARRLAGEPGTRVVLADDLSRGREDAELRALLARPEVSLERCDLTDPLALRALGNAYDEVYHLAAVIGVRSVLADPARVVRVNALGTLHLLDWLVAGGGRRLVFASTSEAYAWTQAFHPLPVPTPEDVPLALTDLREPRAAYAGSKIFGELAVQQYGLAHGLPTTCLRYHNVYGPRMGTQHVIPELALRALGGEDPLRVAAADHTRAFCYVDDAVAASVAAMRAPEAVGQTFHVGDDREELAIGELAQRILSSLGLEAALAPVPAPHDPIRRRCPDATRARRLLGWEPRVGLDEGLARTLPWYRQREKTLAPR